MIILLVLFLLVGVFYILQVDGAATKGVDIGLLILGIIFWPLLALMYYGRDDNE